jgi:hypothetical protein
MEQHFIFSMGVLIEVKHLRCLLFDLRNNTILAHYIDGTCIDFGMVDADEAYGIYREICKEIIAWQEADLRAEKRAKLRAAKKKPLNSVEAA